MRPGRWSRARTSGQSSVDVGARQVGEGSRSRACPACGADHAAADRDRVLVRARTVDRTSDPVGPDVEAARDFVARRVSATRLRRDPDDGCRVSALGMLANGAGRLSHDEAVGLAVDALGMGATVDAVAEALRAADFVSVAEAIGRRGGWALGEAPDATWDDETVGRIASWIGELREPEPGEGEPDEGEGDERAEWEAFPLPDGAGEGWAPVEFRRHRLSRRAPGGRGRRLDLVDEGAIPRRLDRLTVDGRVFGEVRPRPGGTVLVDASGSMSWSPADLAATMAAAPGATVAVYGTPANSGGYRRSYGPGPGVVAIVAGSGFIVPDLQAATVDFAHGGNGVDGPALRWLLRQRGPRVWVCDGQPTGLDENGLASDGTWDERTGEDLRDECRAIVARGRIVRVLDAEGVVRALGGWRGLGGF